MITEVLRKHAPYMLDIIDKIIIGGDGTPGEGVTGKPGGLIRKAEDKYGETAGSFWYRELRPDDDFLGPSTAHTYSATYRDYTVVIAAGVADGTERLLRAASEFSVPTREAIVSFGWYNTIDFNKGGYLEVRKFGVTKQQVPSWVVLDMEKPDHFYFDLTRYITGYENDKIDFRVYNGCPTITARKGVVFPIAYRIASKAALNLETVMI